MKKSARRTKSHAAGGKKRGASRISAAATKLKRGAARKAPSVAAARRARGARLQQQKKKRQQARKQAGGKKLSSSAPAAAAGRPAAVVRIMGHGQFVVDARTLRRLNDIDDSLVDMVEAEVSVPAAADDAKFKKSLDQLGELVKKHGKKVEPGEIVRSDIILPSADMPIDEAKKLFRGEGVVPGP